MNEATLEARLNSELQRIFPFFGNLKVSHQDILTLKFGHETIEINGKERYRKFGRYDVLVKVAEKPLILFELKSPEKNIRPEDRDQAISYARLLDVMPPLVVISNGNKTEIYTTHDKQIWKPDGIDEKALLSLIEHSLSCAANEKDDAVRLLLGRQPEIWIEIIRQFTKDNINARHGQLSDLTNPLATGFSLPRNIVEQLADIVLSGKQIVALVGPPLSGKTNVISQLCRRNFEGLVPLYIDGSSLNYGVLQYISNIFANKLFRVATANEIRNWLLNCLRNTMNGRLVIIIDGWSSNVSEQIKADINEILDICKDHAVSILIALDEYSQSSITDIAGRPTKTELGQKITTIELESLTDDEFDLAGEYFWSKYNVVFHHGAQYNEEYRNPRVLRILASNVLHYKPSKNKANKAFFIPSVTTVDFLGFAWEYIASNPSLRMDLKKLVKAFIQDKSFREADPELSLRSHGRGYITYETAENELGSERLTRLLSQGHISLINYKSGNVLVIPKVPELFASPAGYYLANEVINLIRQNQIDKAYEYLINESNSMPYGDIVGAMAIIEVTKSEESFLTSAIYKLVQDKPHVKNPPKDWRPLIEIPKLGAIPIQIKDLTDGHIISNYHPWLILSHLANFPMALKDGSRNIQTALFDEVGSFPEVLRRPDSISSKVMKRFHVHEMTDIGTILCHQTGIVEPITQAMLKGFYEIPDEMLQLCRDAVDKKKWILSWRLYLAAMATQTSANHVVSESSKEAIEMICSFQEDFFKKLKSSCEAPTRPVRKKQKKVGRNQPCICGSGVKYKKCCGKS
jgi:hypothetical protein